MERGISTPHSLFAASKRERAVEPSKRKNALRGTCAFAQVRLSTGAVLLGCHQFCTHLPARAGLFPRIGGPRVSNAAVIAGGHRKARPPGPADAAPALPGERQRKEKQGVSGRSQPPRHPRRGQRLSWNPKRSLTAKASFSLGPCIAQPLAALPLTDAAYPLRVRPVLFLGRQTGTPAGT